jgi:hypothetical protein
MKEDVSQLEDVACGPPKADIEDTEDKEDADTGDDSNPKTDDVGVEEIGEVGVEVVALWKEKGLGSKFVVSCKRDRRRTSSFST